MRYLSIIITTSLLLMSCNGGQNKNVYSGNSYPADPISDEFFYSKAYAEGELHKYLSDIILSRVERGDITAYTGEDFNQEWNYEEWIGYSNRIDSFYMPDAETNEPSWEIRSYKWTWDDIAAYKFKSKLNNRHESINYAIAPMYSLMSDGSPIGEVELFWVRVEDLLVE